MKDRYADSTYNTKTNSLPCQTKKHKSFIETSLLMHIFNNDKGKTIHILETVIEFRLYKTLTIKGSGTVNATFNNITVIL